MANKGRQTVRQGDIQKALKAARAAGLHVVGFDVAPDGSLSVKTANGATAEVEPSAFDTWQRSRDARPA